MNILIWAAGMPFDGSTIPSGKSLGGSESAAYFMSRELSFLGHDVCLFTRCPKPGRYDGVVYDDIGKVSKETPLGDRFEFAAQVPFDVTIIQRTPAAFYQWRPMSKLNIWWLHDLALKRNQQHILNTLVNVDAIFTVSDFHRQQVADTWGIDKEFIIPTHNGVDYSLFENLGNIKRQPRSLLFAARPERGLENLVGEDGIMTMLPECHLYVCGYDNMVPEMENYYRYLWQRCNELPNVTNLGALGKTDLYQALSRCELYVYPTTFEDTSCIMVLEANAAGTPFVGCKNAALPETCKDSGSVLIPLNKGEVNKQQFANTIKRLLDRNNDEWPSLHQRALKKKQDWAGAAKQWVGVFNDLFAQKTSSEAAMIKHFEKHSDIVALSKYCDSLPKLVSFLPDFCTNYRFFLENDYAEHYRKYYEYEANRGVEYGPEDLSGNKRFEATYNTLMDILDANYSDDYAAEILDFGCAHGHYCMNIMKRDEHVRFTGVDIDDSNIVKARKWAQQEGFQRRSSFHVSDLDSLPRVVDKQFDIILLCETLEHLPNPQSAVSQLLKHLKDNGHLIITVPYGPWEWLGYKEHPGWRAHLHHFEREDLKDMFSGQAEYKCMAVPHTPLLGHWLAKFRKTNEKIGEINYERKLRLQSPQQTLSVCMIAKDAEYTIGKTLSSVKNIADEIIVAVDRTTTDNTIEMCRRFGATTIDIDSPIDTGFDEARNKSIEPATMDWILWIDSDEKIDYPDRIARYLRNNCVNGYGVNQVHVSTEPQGLLKVDYPVRLFRNNQGIKFFGVVHEHPEKELNESVGTVFVAPDVSIMHDGYICEEVRKRRFARNYPLMVRDRQKYPNRKLGELLWLRDISHINRYELQRNGNNLTDEVLERAKQAINLFHKMIDEKCPVRFVHEGLQYYSENVLYLMKDKGFKFKFDYTLHHPQSNGNTAPAAPCEGYFQSKRDIEKVIKYILDVSTEIYGEKYL